MMDWFRSHHGAPTDPKWRTIAKRARVAPAIVVSLAWALLDIASQSADRGSMAGADPETLADFMGCEVDEVERVIAAMVDKGVLADSRFTAWERRQVKREDDGAAERQREKRAREKAERDAPKQVQEQCDLSNVTQCHAPSRDVTLEQSREEQSREEPGKPGHAGGPAREAGPSRADNLRSLEAQCRDALAGVDPPKGSFAPMALLVERGADPDEVVTVLRAEAVKPRKTPIASWPGWAHIVADRLAAKPPPTQPRAAPPPLVDDSPRVNTPSGPRSLAFLRAEHEAGRWSKLYGPAVGKPGCPLALEPAE